MSASDEINDFLKQKRLAIVGVSRGEKDFTRSMFREFVKRGYDAVPVNPAAEEIDGKRCYAKVSDIKPAVDGVLIMTPPKKSESIVLDCEAAGVRRIWLYRAVGQGAVSRAAIGYCKAKGISVIPGYCPHMFLPNPSIVHRVHGLLLKISGAWPS
jgi:predicted CoA-binding protein